MGQIANVLLVSGLLVLGADLGLPLLQVVPLQHHMGWRWIFIFSIIFAVIGMFLLKDTPESKQASTGAFKFDYSGLAIFIVTMIALNVFITFRIRFRMDKPTYNRINRCHHHRY